VLQSMMEAGPKPAWRGANYTQCERALHVTVTIVSVHPLEAAHYQRLSRAE